MRWRRLHVPELYHPVGQQPQRPARPTLGGSEQETATRCASALPSTTCRLDLPGFLGISATSRSPSEKRLRSRATVAAEVPKASAIRSSVRRTTYLLFAVISSFDASPKEDLRLHATVYRANEP